eukprot:812985_1
MHCLPSAMVHTFNPAHIQVHKLPAETSFTMDRRLRWRVEAGSAAVDQQSGHGAEGLCWRVGAGAGKWCLDRDGASDRLFAGGARTVVVLQQTAVGICVGVEVDEAVALTRRQVLHGAVL